jgi:RND family efflux transporter MFP subunit
MKTTLRFLPAILITLLFVQCSNKENSPDKTKQPEFRVVRVIEAKPTRIENTVEATGTIEAKVVANIIAPIDGSIAKLTVKENDFVNKNKTIAVINSQERTTLLANAQAKLEDTKRRLEATDKDSPDYNLFREELDQAFKEYDYADRLFLGVPVVSPISGVVTKKFVELGGVVTAKQVMLTVADFNSLVIKTAVSEQLLPKIKVGQKISVKINAYPDKQFTGVVSLIYPQIDPLTRTFQLEVKVNSNGMKLQPGMMAVLTFITESKPNAITLPNDIILTKPNGDKFVFVVNDSVAQERIITAGISTREFTEILQGVDTGEKVVAMGQEMLKNKMKVKIQQSENEIRKAR